MVLRGFSQACQEVWLVVIGPGVTLPRPGAQGKYTDAMERNLPMRPALPSGRMLAVRGGRDAKGKACMTAHQARRQEGWTVEL